MANSLDGGRRASVDLSFHNGNSRPVDRDADGGDQHGAEDDTLRKYVDPEERHADAHDGDDQGPDKRAPGTADAPRYRGSADDDRGDRRQQEFGRQGRRRLPDLHAGSIGGGLSGADRRAVPSEAGVRL